LSSDIARGQTAGWEKDKPDAPAILYLQDEKGPDDPSLCTARRTQCKQPQRAPEARNQLWAGGRGAQEKGRDGHYLALCFIGLLPYGQGKGYPCSGRGWDKAVNTPGLTRCPTQDITSLTVTWYSKVSLLHGSSPENVQ